MTSTKSFPSYTQVRKDLTTEATATSVEDNADWGGIENLDVPQTESQAEKDAAAAKKAAEEEAEKQAEVEAQATQEQANAASRNESRSSVTYSDASGSVSAGAHYDHVALYVGNGQAVHGGWNGYSVALASAMTEKLTIVVRIP